VFHRVDFYHCLPPFLVRSPPRFPSPATARLLKRVGGSCASERISTHGGLWNPLSLFHAFDLGPRSPVDKVSSGVGR